MMLAIYSYVVASAGMPSAFGRPLPYDNGI